MGDDRTLHLINPLRNRYGGSDRRTIETRQLLSDHCDVNVWCASDASPQLKREAGARVINPLLFRFPRRGTLVFVGAYYSIGRWIGLTSPARVLVIFNTDQPRWLRNNLARIASSGCSAEVIYTSYGLRDRHNGVGPVLESPIDLTNFSFRDPAEARERPFTVGRLSRDHASKHHAEDPALYKRLALAGIRVKLMGATQLAGVLAGTPGIEILPEGAMPPAQFLRGLDAFVYRTSHTWYESFGRVVFEAMAVGVPVVCAPAGGYAQYLIPGRTALLAEDTDKLASAILALRDNPVMAAELARSARAAVEAQQANAQRQSLALLLGDPLPGATASFKDLAPTLRTPPGD